VVNGPLPAALDDWALPIAQLGEGAKYYRHDPAEAKRLLAAAGHPNGFQASVCFATYGSTQLVDHMQVVLKQFKDVGIDARLDQKEYGAYQASCRLGKFDSLGFGPLTPFLEPDSFLFGQYYTGEPRNRSHVNDPALDDLLVRQRRTANLKQRREVIHQIQRHPGASAVLHPRAVGELRLGLGPGAPQPTFSPGTIFGEVALLDKQPRSATVTADEDLVCYELAEDGFHGLTSLHPRIAIHLLMNLGAELSRRLRRSTATVSKLES
jgi:ABC-type transport system substrate-binding protein